MEVDEIKKMEQEKEKKRKKRYIIILLLILLLMGVTAGYAVITTNLNINGVSHIKNVTIWDVHFENLEISKGSVEATIPPSIDSSKTKIYYAVNLEKPGDFYEFTVDLKNSGGIDARLENLPIISGISKEQEKFVTYTVSHADDSPIIIGEVTETGQARKFKIHIGIDRSVTNEQMPEEKQVLILSVDIPYKQA